MTYKNDTANEADPDADRRKRVAASNWRRMPVFAYRPPEASSLAAAALPGLATVLAWLALVGLLLWRTTRRLGAN